VKLIVELGREWAHKLCFAAMLQWWLYGSTTNRRDECLGYVLNLLLLEKSM